jgi:integrase
MATIKIKHLLRKSGLLYYQRGIPLDLRQHYSGRALILHNLKTQDLSMAARLCSQYAMADDNRWQALRSGVDLEAYKHIIRVAQGPKPLRLSDALERYLSEHRQGKDIKFVQSVRLALELVIKTIGDKELKALTRDHARAVRDALIPNHSTATIRRRLNSINSVLNFARKEFDITCGNPFERMQIGGEGLDSKKRLPFTSDELTRIAAACHEMDDDIRWIVALQVGTGARLAEIIGLRRADILINCEITHINIRPHEALGRRLKTPSSERDVPLIGLAAWGAQQALAAATHGGSGWLFGRYAQDNNIRATHASNTINKWFAQTLGIPKTTHSARHSMKDRLRDAGVARDLVEELMGHGTRSVADSYGQGFSLQRKSEAMAKVALPI